MSEYDLVVSGNVVLSDRIIQNGYVAVRGGRIAEVGEGTPPAARERNCSVLAGVPPSPSRCVM